MKKLLIIKHAIHGTISTEEIDAALPEELKAIPRPEVLVQPIQIPLGESHDYNWPELAMAQMQIFEKEIKPILYGSEEYEIAYFGLAPIPLAIHLGYLIGPIPRLWIFQRNHDTQLWAWKSIAPNEKLTHEVSGEPNDLMEVQCDIICRIHTSYDIQPENSTTVVGKHGKEIDLKTNVRDKDIFASHEDLKAFVNRFGKILDILSDKFPNMDTLHLFAATTVGTAFGLGAKVNRNVHQRIQTYQFSQGKYEAAIVLTDTIEVVPSYSDADKVAIANLRLTLAEEYERIKESVSSQATKANKLTSPRLWAEHLFDVTVKVETLATGRWRHLPLIESTPLLKANVDKIISDSGDRFYDEKRKTWLLDDGFLYGLLTKLRNEDRIRQAFRLFVFHESCHFGLGLSSYVAAGIGRFPRVLEEADYYADVYAYVHEMWYTIKTKGEHSIKNYREFLAELILLSIDTMWAFDSNAEMSRPQVRRVNRYLIWYYLRAVLLLGDGDGLESIFREIESKPILDLRGPVQKPELENRIVFLFKKAPSTIMSLAIYDYLNRVRRVTHDTFIQIGELPNAFAERDSEKIQEIIDAFCDITNK